MPFDPSYWTKNKKKSSKVGNPAANTTQTTIPWWNDAGFPNQWPVQKPAQPANNTASPGYGGTWTPNIPSFNGTPAVSGSPGYGGNWVPSYANALPSYGMSPNATLWQESPYPTYKPPGTEQPAQQQKPLGYDYGMMLDNISQQSSTGEFMASTPAAGQPLDNKAAAPTAGQPSYELDAYNNPIDPYWDQNNANSLQWNQNGTLEPRPGVPAAYAFKDLQSVSAWEAANQKAWTSSYTPGFYETQRPDDFNVWGIAGGMGKRNGTTQLRWNTPTPDWVRKVLDKNKDTNKSYDQSQLDQNKPVNLNNIPGWAGDLVSWRT